MNTSLYSIFKSADEVRIETEKSRLLHSWQELERRRKALGTAEDASRIHNVPTDRIFPNQNQPRRRFADEAIISLADSIRQHGILQPLTVRRIAGSGDREAVFEIIAGERRFRAAKLLGLETVPCILRDADDRSSAELAMVENLQREDLDIFEQAEAIAVMVEACHLTQEEAARRLSVSQSSVANKLRLLRFTEKEREMILKCGLTERHARSLLRIPSSEERMRAMEYISAHSLNVAATEAYVDRFLAESKASRPPRAPRKVVLKDIRIFYNSIDRAISMVKLAGVNVESSRVEDDDGVELTIRIPRSHNVSRETSPILPE